MTPVEIAILVMRLLPTAIKAGKDIAELVDVTTDVLEKCQNEKRDPSPEDWDTINTIINKLEAELKR